jgi:hypothetical protein
VSVNGKVGDFLFDTGAWHSVMSARMAARLELKLDATNRVMHGSSGQSTGFREAVAKELDIGGTRIRSVSFAVIGTGPSETTQLRELSEGVEHFEPWAPKVSVVSCRDRQPVASRSRGDVAVLDGHTLAGLVEQSLLLCPDVSDRHVESVNAPVQGVNQPRQPRMERLTLATILRAHPTRQLRVALNHSTSGVGTPR